MKKLDISKLTMPDGSSVQDRVDALSTAINTAVDKDGKKIRGFTIIVDPETGQIYLAGNLPNPEELAKILEHAVEGIQKGDITYEEWPKKQ